jgi:hypothetical protein
MPSNRTETDMQNEQHAVDLADVHAGLPTEASSQKLLGRGEPSGHDDFPSAAKQLAGRLPGVHEGSFSPSETLTGLSPSVHSDPAANAASSAILHVASLTIGQSSTISPIASFTNRKSSSGLHTASLTDRRCWPGAHAVPSPFESSGQIQQRYPIRRMCLLSGMDGHHLRMNEACSTILHNTSLGSELSLTNKQVASYSLTGQIQKRYPIRPMHPSSGTDQHYPPTNENASDTGMLPGQ